MRIEYKSDLAVQTRKQDAIIFYPGDEKSARVELSDHGMPGFTVTMTGLEKMQASVSKWRAG